MNGLMKVWGYCGFLYPVDLDDMNDFGFLLR